MLATLLVLLITSTPGVGNAPALAPWPSGLPAAITQKAGAVLLPKALADAVHERLELLDLYPSMCQSALDTQGMYLAEQQQAALDVELAKAQAKALDTASQPSPTDWTWYDKAAVVVGAGALGFAVGFFAHVITK